MTFELIIAQISKKICTRSLGDKTVHQAGCDRQAVTPVAVF